MFSTQSELSALEVQKGTMLEDLDVEIASLESFSEGDVVEYGDGNIGVIVVEMASSFDWPEAEDEMVDVGDNQTIYIVARETGGAKPFEADDLSSIGEDEAFGDMDDDAEPSKLEEAEMGSAYPFDGVEELLNIPEWEEGDMVQWQVNPEMKGKIVHNPDQENIVMVEVMQDGEPTGYTLTAGYTDIVEMDSTEMSSSISLDSAEELVSVPGVDDPGIGFDSWPDSWEEADEPARLIALRAWMNMGGTWSGCYREIKSKRVCSAYKDELLGTTAWRSWDD